MKTYIKYLILLGIALLAITGITLRSPASDITTELSNSLLRLRIIAAGDSKFCQDEKLAVKEAVVNLLAPRMSKASTKEEAKAVVNSYMEEIKSISREITSKNGSNHSVTASLTNHYFPLKTYGDLVFPPGEYETLLITLGDAAGSNWWCVVYPPLCFVDAAYGTVPEESDAHLKDTLSDDAYQGIHGEEKTPKIGFRLWDLISGLFS